METKNIEVSGIELVGDKKIQGLKTDVNNRIQIKREVLPIIFVPGIMGSRLKKKTGEKVWDPDAKGFMLKKYGLPSSTPKQRKNMLIGGSFSSDYLEVIKDDEAHCGKFKNMVDTTRKDRGWGEIMWGSYGRLLLALQTREWEEPLNLCFEFPVHAFGYNWTDSNYSSGEKLAKYIDDTIAKYKNERKRECKKVILITHSMGGMVARSACKLHGAERNVVGIIHGAQPSTGAAAAYWRCKAGFERNGLLDPSAWVLGTNGEEVTCIFGNAPAPLELLPNKHYKDNKGNEAWLQVPKQNGTIESFPKSGDPYNEIYRMDKDVFWRMINPAWLDPADAKKKVKTDEDGRNKTKSARNEYGKCLDQAEDFHNNLGVERHDSTYQFYSAGVDTVDRIYFERQNCTLGPQMQLDGMVIEADATPQTRGRYVAYVDQYDKLATSPESVVQAISMAMPGNCGSEGDGTVPVSSSKKLAAKDTAELKKVMHQDFYEDGKARDFVIKAVWNLAQARITEVVGNK